MDLHIYEIVCNILFVLFLLILSVFDLIAGRIPLLIFIAGAVITGAFYVLSPAFDLKDSIGGIIAGGGIFLLLYVISKKGAGEGDIAVMAFAGLVLGLYLIVPVIVLSTLLFAFTGILLNIFLKSKKFKSMPFIPFVTVSYIILIFI